MSSGESDEVKGKIKGGAGKLTGDDDLRREGKADEAGGKAKQAGGKAKQAGEKLADAAHDAVDAVRGKR